MTILDTIVARKKVEVAEAKAQVSLEQLQAYPLFSRKPLSLQESAATEGRSGIIAEYKRASPSKGLINGHSTVQEVVQGYEAAGAIAVSVLTDQDFFQGSLADLTAAREVLNIPILRKEFIVDRYQIAEAKAYGADIILLIVACLSDAELSDFAAYAKELGLSILLEVHDQAELTRGLSLPVDAIGVNNRNLKNFVVSLDHSYALVNEIPAHVLKVSESGISEPATIRALKEAGFQAFLIGENFMKTTDPALAIAEFVAEVG